MPARVPQLLQRHPATCNVWIPLARVCRTSVQDGRLELATLLGEAPRPKLALNSRQALYDTWHHPGSVLSCLDPPQQSKAFLDGRSACHGERHFGLSRREELRRIRR